MEIDEEDKAIVLLNSLSQEEYETFTLILINGRLLNSLPQEEYETFLLH